MKSYRIAVYPGDGIGVDVTHEAMKVLLAAAKRQGVGLDLTEYPWGAEYSRHHNGEIVPSDFMETLRGFDAIFLGAVGDPRILPDHVTLMPLMRMRQEFEQYVCLRPATLLPGVSTPLAGKRPGDIDMLIVRENSEGEYTGAGGGFKRGMSDEISIQSAIHTRKGVTRILRYAFECARKQGKRLAMATKSNALNHSMVMWDGIFAEIAAEYADVESEKFHIDALAMHFVRSPERFQVVVASNLFGDILSDLAGAMVGSLGLAPSANINPERNYPSLFEPVHGSAPDIAGKGIANPIAAIRSAAMMLDFLGESSELMEKAVLANLSDGNVLTPDLGGTATTSDIGDDIVARMQ